jgi:hypothetical protein
MSFSKQLKHLRLKHLRKYLSDKEAFKKAGGVITAVYPIFNECKKQAGVASGHYFHQDLLVASLVNKANPIRHIDVGSSIEGFVAHVASYRNIEVFDIRPLRISGHEQIKFVQGNLMELEDSLIGICDSLSCLHVLEHFGLGRYGDPIDPDGHRRGFNNLHRMLQKDGMLYISFPIGGPGVHFNAHRVFKVTEMLEWIKGKFELVRFDYVDDAGDLHCQATIPLVPELKYGCGIYTLRKTND